MALDGICLNCFSQRGDYEVCPYCGYVAGTLPTEGYILQPGTRLWGRYIMGTVLGTGGFGITYRAWDTRLNAQVAIKEFFPQSLVSRIPGEGKVRVFSGDKQESYSQQLGRFMDEAKNLAKFTGDAHIVSVLDYFEDNGTAYIVMEYLDGVTLKEYITQQGGRLGVQQALAIETDLLKALSSIHSKGIIHRDISPDNIFILKDGTMKVLDFGAARFAVREDSELTQGVVVKKGYAPPEQYRTNMKQGVWTDIYAAGATLYKMVTGATPEESIERTEKDVLKRPSQTGTAVDAAVDKAVMKAMALRPELRFKSAEAMLAALENRTVVDFPEEELKKRRGRNRLLIALSVVVVLALGVLVAWQASNRPASVAAGPSLADMTIEPDSITIYTYGYEENAAAFTQLVEAFTDKYPEHTVTLETFEYYEGLGDEIAPRFLSADAPAVFIGYYPNLDQDETPYMADLSPLYNALNMADYRLLEQYWRDNLSEETGELYTIPTGFYFATAYVHTIGVQERGITAPTKVDSYEQLIEWEKAMPGSIDMYSHYVGEMLGIFKPEIWEKKDLKKLEQYVGDYAEMYQQGYFQQYHQDMQYEYSSWMLSFGSSSTESYRRNMEGEAGMLQMIPVVYNGKLSGYTTDHYAVSSKVTENQQKVGMLFLHFLLSEYGQNMLHVQNDNEMPLHKKVMDQLVDANPDYAFVTGEYADKFDTDRANFYFNELYDVLRDGGGREEAQAVVREAYGGRTGWS